ncbi:MAG: hypothetical protein II797_00820 [Clostridia bacterium]|nr:hypothetical protein [Clostridia bacterium]
MKAVKISAVLLAFGLLLSVFSGCGPKLSGEELRETVKPLLVKSVRLNEILFGDGLQAETSEARLARYFEALNLTRETAAYLPVSSSSDYLSEEQITKAVREVYAASYAEHLIRLAFYGIAPGDDDEVELGLVPVIYARYKTQDNVFANGDKVLCVRADAGEDAFPLADVSFDFDTVRAVGSGVINGTAYIRFTVDVSILDDGAEALRLNTEFRIVEEKGVWKLDSPTYFSRELIADEEN